MWESLAFRQTNTDAYNKWQICTRRAPAKHIWTWLLQSTSASKLKALFCTKDQRSKIPSFKVITDMTVRFWPTWEAVFIHSQQISGLIQIAAQMVACSTWNTMQEWVLHSTVRCVSILMDYLKKKKNPITYYQRSMRWWDDWHQTLLWQTCHHFCHQSHCPVDGQMKKH